MCVSCSVCLQACVEVCAVKVVSPFTDVTGMTVTEVPPLIRQGSAASTVKDLEEGRVPQTETFAEIVEAMLNTK